MRIEGPQRAMGSLRMEVQVDDLVTVYLNSVKNSCVAMWIG